MIQGAPSHRIQTRIGWSAPNRRVAEAELILLAADDDIDYLQFTNKTPIPLDFLFRCQLSKSLPLFELRELNSKKDVKLIGVLSLDTNGNVVLKIGIYLTESALVYGRDEEDNGTLSPGLVPGQWKVIYLASD